MDTAQLQQSADAIAQEWGLSPQLFRAQIAAESGWDPHAVSPAGCVGIAQICDSVSIDKTDPIASMNYMAQRMSNALRTYNGNYAAALASYNCGGSCADAWFLGHGDLPAETQTYINTILGAVTSNAAPQGTPGTTTTSPSSFAPRALSSSSATLLVIFAAAVLLLGVAAGAKKGMVPRGT